ncbi:Uncharacterised protein [Pseudomonas aeruginosa]|nr:Uncharacterised protein [Pseudomonas aeruginosa]
MFLLGDDAQHLAGLGTAHHRGATVRPGEDEARVEAASAHRVVAGAVGAADHQGQLGHAGVGHRLDHLRAVLDHALALRLGADHEAGGVVQEQQRRVALFAELDELRRLGRALRGDRSVVADQAAGVALDAQVAADGLAVELVLEVEELGAVGDARDDLADVVGLLRVGRNHPEQLLHRVQRFTPGTRRARRQLCVPRQHADDLAGQAHAVGVVFRQVFRGAGDLRVQFGSAELLVAGDLAGGGLEQRRPGEEHLGLAAHHHHVVRQPRLVGTAGGAGTMHHGDLGNAHGGDPRLVGEAARTFDEDLRRVVEVGATAFGEGHHRQLVLHGDLLQAQGLLQPGRGDGAALDRAVAGTDQAAHPGDVADPGDDPAAGLGAVLVVVQLVAGQRGQFEERRARVEQQRQAFARQQLAAFLELRPGLGGLVQDLLLQLAEAGHGGEHGLAVAGEVLAVDVEFRLDRGHVSPPGPSVRRAGRRGGSRCTRGSVPACP